MPKIPVYFRYVGASAAALAVDFSMFMLALSLGMAPEFAAAFGYMMGIVAHWPLSSRVVFTGRLAPTLGSRVQQQALFVGSALAGLAVTMAVVGVGSRYGCDPRLAKVLAIAVSFNVTFLLRKKVVFG